MGWMRGVGAGGIAWGRWVWDWIRLEPRRGAVSMVLSCPHRPLEPLAAPVTEERDATWDLRSSGLPGTS
jgi:hypothetical protein